MKDYYDVYYIMNYMFDLVDVNLLKDAADATFKKREFYYDVKMFEIIRDSLNLKKKWMSYSRKYKYANNIKYEEVIETIYKLIKYIY